MANTIIITTSNTDQLRLILTVIAEAAERDEIPGDFEVEVKG